MNIVKIKQAVQAMTDSKQAIIDSRLSPFACKSQSAIRRVAQKRDFRPPFIIDAQRIAYSRMFGKLTGKTQLYSMGTTDTAFYLNRGLHAMHVTMTARLIGRFLDLNEDLIEAIAMGHDGVHAPFGHSGEKALAAVCKANKLPGFIHSVHSVRVLDEIESTYKKIKPLNLTLQVLDGILTHDGEANETNVVPAQVPEGDTEAVWSNIQEAMVKKENSPHINLYPFTLEGCVVRFSDSISFIGRDIEDAISSGMIEREDIPKDCVKIIGDSDHLMRTRLIMDIVANSAGKNSISLSAEASRALFEMKEFERRRIHPHINETFEPQVVRGMSVLFDKFLDDIETGNRASAINRIFMRYVTDAYKEKHSSRQIVRDFIASLTDTEFMKYLEGLVPKYEMPPVFNVFAWKRNPFHA